MRGKWLWAIPLLLIVAYFAGPNPSSPVLDKKLPSVPPQPGDLEDYIESNESMHKIKPDNEARIIWADIQSKQKTPYSIVYLHGFSASQAEGEPVHRDIAKQFGCNLYLPRLADHGLDTTEAMAEFTADKLWESAKEALVIGRQLGEKVIIMGTSTGGTLAILLAAEYPDVHSLVLLSPNIAINDPNAWLLNNPWGLYIARKVLNSDYVVSKDQRDLFKRYWYPQFRLEALVQLQELVESTMTEETFRKVKQPVLTLYYYKDEINQDSVVRVDAMKTMIEELGTPRELNVSRAMPQAGAHVIGSYIKSSDVTGVENEIAAFMKNTLRIPEIVAPQQLAQVK